MAREARLFGAAAVLTAAVAVTKVIGALYKIPLGNLLGSQGMAHFYVAYNIYNVLLLLSTAGLPPAVSRLVAAGEATGRHGQAQRFFSVALALLTAAGLLCGGVMLLLAGPLARALHDPPAAAAIRTLAPSVSCVCVASAVRGYTQGLGRMGPTAVSQLLESCAKLAVGLWLCRWLLERGLPPQTAAAGAIAGVTAGSVLSLLYLLRYLPVAPARGLPVLRRRDAARQLLHIAAPITAGSAGMSLITLLDQSLTLGALQRAQGCSVEAAAELYGQYTFGMTLFVLPASFIVPLTAALLPAISGALARGDRPAALGLTREALQLTGLAAFPMGLGLSALAEPLLLLLYPAVPDTARAAAAHLAILGPASVCVCLVTVTTGILQAWGRERLPLVSLLCGGALKVAANYLLVSHSAIGIRGAPISTLYCYALIALVNGAAIRYTVGELPLLPLLGRSAAAALLMAAGCRAGYGFLCRYLPDRAATLGAVALAIPLYAALALGGRRLTFSFRHGRKAAVS